MFNKILNYFKSEDSHPPSPIESPKISATAQISAICKIKDKELRDKKLIEFKEARALERYERQIRWELFQYQRDIRKRKLDLSPTFRKKYELYLKKKKED